MKYIFSILLFSCFVYQADSQTPAFLWAKSFGSTSNDYVTSIALDNSGNTISTGNFGNTIDFDPGSGIYNLTSNGHFDIYILKLNTTGGLIWAKSIGGDRADMSTSIKLDNNGNIFIAGSFSGTTDFDPNAGIHTISTSDPNSGASFLLKLDPNGNFLWVKQFENAEMLAIDVDNAGNLYATGGFYAITDFDPGPGIYNLTEFSYTGNNNGVEDEFILKLDATGNFQWVKQIGGTQTEQAKSICLDASGKILTTGYFAGTADFDPGTSVANLISNGNIDIFISKLDQNGNFLWAKNIGGALDDRSGDIVADNSGEIYIGGAFYSTVDFDPGPGIFNLTSTGADIFILKLSSTGNLVWVKQQAGSSEEYCRALTLDNTGNLYITGAFENTCDFDPGPSVFSLTSNGFQDIFISKLDITGNFMWATAMGSVINYDYPFDIIIDASRNIYSVGFYWGTVDFDPGPGLYNLTMVDYGDAYIQKLSQCNNITYSSITAFACNSYTLNNQLYTNSGTYTQSLTNAAGCDSIITLNLTIGGSSTLLSTTSCDSYSWEGQVYTNSGTYTVTYTGSGGCDSILTLNLTIKSSTSTNITTSICEGQTYEGYSTTGIYSDIFTATNGCDSTRTLNLTVKSRSALTLNKTICEGETYEGYSSPGTYISTFVAANGCDSIRTLHLLVNPKKTTNINAAICSGETYFAGGALQHNPGIYRDTLRTYLNCDSIIITNLAVHAKPGPDLGPDKDLCIGSDLVLNPGNFRSYLWQDLSTQSTYRAHLTGLYWVTVTDNNNCIATDSVRINTIHQLPANFLAATDSLCTYDKLVLQPTIPYSSYFWSNGLTHSTITIKDPGLFWLQVTDVNGCKGADTILVLTKSCSSGIFIPSAFTPNGDGKNDKFKAIVHGNLVSFKLEVFNRNGELVFQSTDPTKEWNGNFKGAIPPTSIYVWQCFFQLEGKQPDYQKGTVALIR